MREINLACGLIQFKHWKIDNPGKFETVWIDQTLILTNFYPGASSKACCLIGGSAGKKHGITVTNTSGDANLFCLLCTERLCHRTPGLTITIDDIAHARRAFGLCPAVHPVSDGAATAFWARHGPHNSTLFHILGKN